MRKGNIAGKLYLLCTYSSQVWDFLYLALNKALPTKPRIYRHNQYQINRCSHAKKIILSVLIRLSKWFQTSYNMTMLNVDKSQLWITPRGVNRCFYKFEMIPKEWLSLPWFFLVFLFQDFKWTIKTTYKNGCTNTIQIKQCNSYAYEPTLPNQDLYKLSTTPITYPNIHQFYGQNRNYFKTFCSTTDQILLISSTD